MPTVRVLATILGTEATTISKREGGSAPGGTVRFDVWGCRGSKSFIPPRSRIGNYTSCYSLQDGSDLFVFDAGLGLASLSYEIHRQRRFGILKRIFVLITHAHLDHWEGLKDADWFWERDNGLEVRIIGLDEAINAIQRGYEHPSFVDLDLLARFTVAKLEFNSFSFGDVLELGDWKLGNMALNHYSGTPEDKSVVQTSGYRLSREGGPVVCYISDHEPGPGTIAAERELTRDANLVLYDSHFTTIAEQRFGHGSQEHSSSVARSFPNLLVVAGHHGPMYSDVNIEKTFRRLSKGLENFALAVEGRGFLWDRTVGKFLVEEASEPHPEIAKAGVAAKG
jgi:phosphoribosyl 1,2-cyclic phosphodiesterase